MTSRERVRRTIHFEGADRLPYDLPDKYGSDFALGVMAPYVDMLLPEGTDEWGCVWESTGKTNLGQVKEFPLKDWKDFDKLNIPDIRDPERWESVDGIRECVGDKFLLTMGISLFERVRCIRGFENAVTDIYESPGELGNLIDVLVDMNLVAIERYAEAGADGYMFLDDWGVQNSLMISPDAWRRIWKSRYERVYNAAHDAGLLTFLHSCGYIVDILDDLIEVGVDVLHMDQQENMGLEFIGERFGGRVTFFSPVDIQNTMARGNLDEIRAYCRKMARLLGRPNGGFIPRWYTDPVGAGHTQEALDAMCEEFVRLSEEHRSSPAHE